MRKAWRNRRPKAHALPEPNMIPSLRRVQLSPHGNGPDQKHGRRRPRVTTRPLKGEQEQNIGRIRRNNGKKSKGRKR
ncbi:hypothetical protein V6N12_073559 [Hibiscus sabdariffa]|uniref:Uncharacterized protein n=1 Tax=Hibiscus sabdariffa TaxID=183260 RepID=A0ABR2BHU2_9ROSI